MGIKKNYSIGLAWTAADHKMKDMKVYCAGLSLEVAWKELEVFSKLLVRGRNQHRRDRCYHMLVRVRTSTIGHFHPIALLSEWLVIINPLIFEHVGTGHH